MDGPMTLATTGLANNDQAFSNALYVHPLDFTRIVDAAGVDAEKVKDAGVLCAVGEAVFYVRQAASSKPGSIGAGMMQRLAAQLVMNSPTPVTPFAPPRGNFPLASIVAEVDLLGGAPAAGQVRYFLFLLFNAHMCTVPPVLTVRDSRQGRTRTPSTDDVPQTRL